MLNTIEKEFVPVILGNDINTYSMSRAFYEEYQVKSIVMGKVYKGPSCNSRIIDFRVIKDLDQQEIFLSAVNSVAEKLASKKVILIGCGDSYVELIIKNKSRLRENIIAPYIEEPLMEELLTKIKFYEMCDKQGVAYPKTFIHTKEIGEAFELAFDFPIILKPSNGIMYWVHEFETQKKVYKLDNMGELKEVLKSIYASGYSDSLIIQEFVPGDDSNLRVMIGFCGKDKKVKLMSLAHVVVEEHTPHGLGNTAALINEYNKELTLMLKGFLESVGYEGFFTFDIKYDEREAKYKVLEINLRQGRSNYYVTAAGDNLAKYVVESYLYNKDHEFKIAQNKNLWTVIPLQIAFRYAKDQKLNAEMRELVKNGKIINPLFMKGDNMLPRLAYLYKLHISHYAKFKKYFD